MSEHFVYIENQFFITSYVLFQGPPRPRGSQHDTYRTTVDDIKIENKIGDAIVQRIFRAHKDQKPWKCCIVIPLLPGFTFPVDHSDASAVGGSSLASISCPRPTFSDLGDFES